MDAPQQLRVAAMERDDVSITQREYDGGQEITIDFGAGADAKVDVVGDTAIVVAGDQQYEFDVPSDASEIRTNDGVLIIRE
jgi:hypothetical protein